MVTFIKRLKRTLLVSTVINVAVFFFLVSLLMFFWDFVRMHKLAVLVVSSTILFITILVGWIKINRLTNKIKRKAGYQ